ncbi:hypothetical protein OIM90_04705 [Streptomyces sp. AD16]|nr:hypothetical protein OIM90_04705 [Streptomyces sp. AD16]
MPVGEAADDGEAGLRDLADLADAQEPAAGDDLAGVAEPVLVQAQAAVVHLDHGAALHGADGDQDAGPRRRVLGGVGEEFGHQVDQRLDHRGVHAQVGLSGDGHTAVGDDAAGGGAHHVDQGERLLPLLAGPLAAEHLEALGVAGLLGGGVVDLHGGFEQVGVAGEAFGEAGDGGLDAVGGGLHAAGQLHQGEPLRLGLVGGLLGNLGEEPVEEAGDLGHRLGQRRGGRSGGRDPGGPGGRGGQPLPQQVRQLVADVPGLLLGVRAPAGVAADGLLVTGGHQFALPSRLVERGPVVAAQPLQQGDGGRPGDAGAERGGDRAVPGDQGRGGEEGGEGERQGQGPQQPGRARRTAGAGAGGVQGERAMENLRRGGTCRPAGVRVRRVSRGSVRPLPWRRSVPRDGRTARARVNCLASK